MLKQQPWPQLLSLMGESGERIMLDLLLDCAIFVPLKAGANNLCQISGEDYTSTIKMESLYSFKARKAPVRR
ncbi:hypothetical protein F4776DRAFT_614090 [Hypoxylon sp. NC0597]|nr:hypothetical protein F4776DRAFT_614090 [Hypoxylon sp. NC0597]